MQRHQARHGRRAGAEPSAVPDSGASTFAFQLESVPSIAAPSPRNGRRMVMPPPTQFAPPSCDPHFGLQPSAVMMRQRLSSQADALYRMAASGPRPSPLPVVPPPDVGGRLADGTALQLRSRSRVRQEEPSEASESEVLRAHLEAGAAGGDVLDDWIRRKHMRQHQPRRPARDAPGTELRANLLSSKQNQWLVGDPTGNRKPGKTAYEQAFMKATGGGGGGGGGAKPAAAPSSGIAHQWTFGGLGR